MISFLQKKKKENSPTKVLREHHHIRIETAKQSRRAIRSKDKKTWDTLEWALCTEGIVKWLPSLLTISFLSRFYIGIMIIDSEPMHECKKNYQVRIKLILFVFKQFKPSHYVRMLSSILCLNVILNISQNNQIYILFLL